jgi:hypothetical protein
MVVVSLSYKFDADHNAEDAATLDIAISVLCLEIFLPVTVSGD